MELDCIINSEGIPPSESEHPDAVLLLVLRLLEEHEVDEEHGSDERRLHPHVEVHWEAGREEGSGGNGFSPRHLQVLNLILLRFRFYCKK